MPYATTDELEVYYETHGEGRPLVLLHGGGNHLAWWQQVPHFQDRYQVITIDFPGYGLSRSKSGEYDNAQYADAILAVLDHAGIDHPEDCVGELSYSGRGEEESRVLVHVQEGVAQVRVTPSVAGLDTPRPDRKPDARLRRLFAVEVRTALVLIELPAHTAGHRVPGDEADPRTGGVEDVVTSQLAERVHGGHAGSLLVGRRLIFKGQDRQDSRRWPGAV